MEMSQENPFLGMITKNTIKKVVEVVFNLEMVHLELSL